MNDKELLELAAKAAGYADAEFQEYDGMDVRYGFPLGIWSKKKYEETNSGYWNPLWDDGDALRLAVKLNIYTDPATDDEADAMIVREPHPVIRVFESHNGDPYAATRRAIVRAAAEIGKSL